MSELKRTPFYNVHKESGAKLIDFGGFEMPVQYAGILKEHEAVRNAAGMFDVSHMGEFYVTGDAAYNLLQFATLNDLDKLVPGKVQYTAMCYEDGGIVDDLLVYMLDVNRYMLVVNASNKDKDLQWLNKLNSRFSAKIMDVSDMMCLLAVQGPKSESVLQSLTDIPLSDIPFYTFKSGVLAGVSMVISATGYTGERGFELYFPIGNISPDTVWNMIMKAGEPHGLQPAGLGARDTLRLEMGYALYGNDISAETNPLEAGLGWITKLQKEDFSGKDAIVQIKETGLDRKLIGLVTSDRKAIPRSHYRLTDEQGNTIGEVTSGGKSPTLGTGIGMGYVKSEFATPGSKIFIDIRGNLYEAEVQRPPFLKKK
ncbi:MAG: glycine cleavage system aminomethyltransferase GcvT [Bacteroidetes bacterium]|nr:glycine cleavage system aminomethyltransferase GcvT [Bacteroidota bacterium]MCH8524890.1 glycine cleavage system aminomethyltransferase GcvT [Balneolales bacterium]